MKLNPIEYLRNVGSISITSDSLQEISLDFLWGRRIRRGSGFNPIDPPDIDIPAGLFQQPPSQLNWWQVRSQSGGSNPPEFGLIPTDGNTVSSSDVFYLALGGDVDPNVVFLDRITRRFTSSNPSLDDAVFDVIVKQPYTVSQVETKPGIGVPPVDGPGFPNPPEAVPEPSLVFSSLVFGAVSMWMRKQRGKLKAGRK
ncbi:MAG: hypothetical protein JGK21_31885 [Microcoleus sp. PH2017_22_RUC_O_B]|uniref:hypothetical protein n=1 Tax=unclassified Microcoleus TaxID=2642155 RepID=UPI001DB42F12|nr:MULTISPECIES: hypothetical protein [unclassified Microcoleus]MCC3531598.1 hypothetical protein [Microcoleus sp. PH2017_21_RUC_O_A]MCC3544826.1 hypothetical protein [Microcoleus sp. PH2017_22_RUC_O_B]